MAKTKISEYSATAASNTDIDSINLSEGVMVPSDLNNAIREQMAHLKDFSDGTTGIDVLNLQDDDASASLKFQAPATVTATVTFTLPDGDGSANQVLKTDGPCTLAWDTVSNILGLGNGTLEVDASNNLLFKYNGDTKVRMTSDGDLDVEDDITAFSGI